MRAGTNFIVCLMGLLSASSCIDAAPVYQDMRLAGGNQVDNNSMRVKPSPMAAGPTKRSPLDVGTTLLQNLTHGATGVDESALGTVNSSSSLDNSTTSTDAKRFAILKHKLGAKTTNATSNGTTNSTTKSTTPGTTKASTQSMLTETASQTSAVVNIGVGKGDSDSTVQYNGANVVVNGQKVQGSQATSAPTPTPTPMKRSPLGVGNVEELESAYSKVSAGTTITENIGVGNGQSGVSENYSGQTINVVERQIQQVPTPVRRSPLGGSFPVAAQKTTVVENIGAGNGDVDSDENFSGAMINVSAKKRQEDKLTPSRAKRSPLGGSFVEPAQTTTVVENIGAGNGDVDSDENFSGATINVSAKKRQEDKLTPTRVKRSPLGVGNVSALMSQASAYNAQKTTIVENIGAGNGDVDSDENFSGATINVSAS
ncbi:hypothetical protein CBS101457_000326 [Exobasidium rhododendri]|nr:hypothetical protein CBS101457_000326 [Exobasidium rhododendri]